jgi:UMF1 family MFS transporter
MIMVVAPIMGAYADIHAAKKKMLMLTTAGCVIFTALLYFAREGSLWLAVVLIILSNFFYGSGENIIAAFLPELAKGSAMGRVSGWGWSLGYVGGMVSLGACLAYVNWAQLQGQTAANFVPVTMSIVAILFMVASFPTFLYLKERAVPQPQLHTGGTIQASWFRLKQTLVHSQSFQDLRRFLICTVLYQAGIQAVITLAAIYAQQAMHFTLTQTIQLIFVVNITAALGAFFLGYVQDKLGHVRTIIITLIGWILMVILAWAAQGPTLFWMAAALAGVCMGSSQSAGRALVGLLSPATRRAEFYGLWGMAVKLSAILGPVTYGLITWISNGNHRLSILITGGYFVAGLVVVLGVNMKRGRRAALRH